MELEKRLKVILTNNDVNPLLKESFVFRPLKQHDNMLQYAEGAWTPDDGQPDMAFVYYDTFPTVEYVRVPYYANILWSWHEITDGKATWHYCTTNKKHWEDYRFESRYNHPNEVADRSGFDKCCSLCHCANGVSISLTNDNDYIRLGKLIIQSSGKPVTKPDNIVCFLCLNNAYGHRLQSLQGKKASLEGDREYYDQQIKDHEINLYDTKHSLERTDEKLVELEQELATLQSCDITTQED